MKMTMKTTVMVAVMAGMFLTGCSDVEMAEINQSVVTAQAEQRDMLQMQRQCKNYLANTITELPEAAFDVRPGYGYNGSYTVPVVVQWDEPAVSEQGNCVIENGVVQRYVVTN